MSFYASNNRIHLTNRDGKVIFDTDKPMPHIIQTISARVSVDFPAVAATYWRRSVNMGASSTCQQYENVCRWQNVCGFVNECGMVLNPSTGMYEYKCQNVYRCEYKNVCGPEWVRYDRYEFYQGFDYAAQDWQRTATLGAIINGLDADFLLINAVATRSRQGQLADMGPLPCGLPLGKTFIANSSSIVETCSDVSNGSPWLSRTMSVFVENGEVKVQFQHSNRAFRANSQWVGEACSWDGVPPYVGGIPTTPPAGQSSFTFDLNIHVGKFTS